MGNTVDLIKLIKIWLKFLFNYFNEWSVLNFLGKKSNRKPPCGEAKGRLCGPNLEGRWLLNKKINMSDLSKHLITKKLIKKNINYKIFTLKHNFLVQYLPLIELFDMDEDYKMQFDDMDAHSVKYHSLLFYYYYSNFLWQNPKIHPIVINDLLKICI